MGLTNLVIAVKVTVLFITVFHSVSGQEICEGVGGVREKSEAETNNHFYINTAAPAACSGYINSFSFCYYRPSGGSNIRHVLTFALYRQSSTSAGTYHNVSMAFVVKGTRTELGNKNFVCKNLSVSDPVPVEVGDMLGACVNDPSDDDYRLDIVSKVQSGQGNVFMSGPDVCSPDSVPSTVSTSTTLSEDRFLNLQAEIVPPTEPPPTMGTTVVSETTPLITDTTTMNVPPTIASTVAVAETTPLDSDTTTMNGLSTTGSVETTESSTNTDTTTMNVPSTIATTVLVTLPATGTVAVTETTPMNSETTPQDTETTTVNGLSTTISMETTESSTNTTGAPVGGDGGAVAAAVIVVLIILVVSAVIVVLVVLLIKKQKLTKRHYSLQTTRGIQDGIDNVVYATGEVNTGNEMSSEYAEIGLMIPGPTSSNLPLYEAPVITYSGHGPPFSDSDKSNEYAYAEVGPYEEVHHGNASANAYESPSTIVYESPLDEPAISYSKLKEKNKEEDIYGSVDPYTEPASQDDAVYAQLKVWKCPIIPPTDIKVEDHLGSGQFSTVDRGQWKRPGTKPVDVALKTLNNTDSEDRLKFLQEAATMAQFRHPNVILLHGVVSRGDPMMLVVELASKGDLRNSLLSMRPDPGELVASNTSNLLLRFSQQVALGMQYLSAKGFVHRDLAARNVLVSTSEICKISDFGMSRNLADESYYMSHGGMIPVKWTAPEAIHYKKYSTASDVWAYGCLLYEIWSIGHKPFEGVSNVNTITLVDSGKRLSPPPGCPKMIYELMILCWHQQTNPRPSFRDIVLTLVDSEKIILNIPVEDSSTHPQAGVLGAPLEAGENMYTDLQNRYLSDAVTI